MLFAGEDVLLTLRAKIFFLRPPSCASWRHVRRFFLWENAPGPLERCRARSNRLLPRSTPRACSFRSRSPAGDRLRLANCSRRPADRERCSNVSCLMLRRRWRRIWASCPINTAPKRRPARWRWWRSRGAARWAANGLAARECRSRRAWPRIGPNAASIACIWPARPARRPWRCRSSWPRAAALGPRKSDWPPPCC